MRKRILWLTGILLGLLAGLLFLHPYWQPSLLILDAAGPQGLIGRLPEWAGRSVRTEDVDVPTRSGKIPGRIYVPSGSPRAAVVVVHGLHAAGIAEERLGPFARKVAARGIVVLTPEMEDLRRYRITPQTTDQIEDSTRWLANEQRFATKGRVGLIGISFSGGLSIVAAGRSSIRDRVLFVLSLGGHGDLYRTAHYLCTGQLPEGRGYLKPHDYAVAVVLLNLCDRLVPDSQSRQLADGITAFLHEDNELGHRMIQQLPQPSSQILGWVEARDASKLAPMMLPHLVQFASDPNLSPERSAPPVAPVFLLHGEGDSLIPSSETESLARYLRGKTEVHWLITPLIFHVQLDQRPKFRDVWNLLRLWERIFRIMG
ncbi:MAG TPA: hypothetical protein VGL91_07770 [Acidobacteriota bacterium]